MADYVVNASGNGGNGMDLVGAHKAIFDSFSAEKDMEVQEAFHEAGKAVRTELRSNSPKRKGQGSKYARSWSLDCKDREGHHEAVVFNRRHWQLIHLLEDGHQSYNQYGGSYGFVNPAKPEHHVQKAREIGARILEEMLGVKL